jgi:hypothetical protein
VVVCTRGNVLRWQGVLLAVLLMVALLLPAPVCAEPRGAAEWTYVSGARLGLRLHAEPGLSTEFLLLLNQGEDVRAQGAPVFVDGLWWTEVRVDRRAGSYTGWVSAAYLANYDRTVAPTDVPSDGVFVSSSGGLNLRRAAGTDREIVYRVPLGTLLQPADDGVRWSGGRPWRQYLVAGERLWAAEDYLQSTWPR